MRDIKDLWKKCVEFHGHGGGDLIIGYKAALYAAELLHLEHAEDEESVSIVENDACGVDAIQVVLGCSVGKGNLLFHLTGKHVYSFYNRKTGESARLVLRRPVKAIATVEEAEEYYWKSTPKDLFDIKPVRFECPESARIFRNCICDECGEITAENYLHLDNNRKLCPDCYMPYHRLDY